MASMGFIKLTDYYDKSNTLFKRKVRVCVASIIAYNLESEEDYKTKVVEGYYTEVRLTSGGHVCVTETPEQIDEILRRAYCFVAEDPPISQKEIDNADIAK